MKQILKSSFLQLLVIYTILIILISLKLIWKYTLHFEIFALILALIGVFVIQKEKKIKISKYWIILALFLILFFRIVPYISNDIPLGYDPGLYKYIMENHQIAEDEWIKVGYGPGLFIITDFLYLIGFNTDTILIWVLIFFELLLGITIYLVTKKFFNREIGVLAILLYAVSITQFKVFWYNYYKNIVALILLLTALYLLKLRDEKPSIKIYALLILVSAFLGGLHRPSFLIFGLIFLAYTVKNSYNLEIKKFKIKDLKINVVLGILILFFTSLFYLNRYKEAIFPMMEPIITANMGAGTFINFLTYQFLSLAYLPFALVGFFYLAKKKKFNLLFMWFVINGAIVYFKLFFFNRFIIHLDIIMIILASLGLYLLLQYRKLGTVVTVLLIISAGYITFNDVIKAKPLIDRQELNIIEQFQDIEDNAFVMSTSSYYSPWLQGYSGRKVIAPGLFDYDNWTREEWGVFWSTDELGVTKELLDRYEKPLYIFIGRYKPLDEEKFNNSCFDLFLEENETKIYKWLC